MIIFQVYSTFTLPPYVLSSIYKDLCLIHQLYNLEKIVVSWILTEF